MRFRHFAPSGASLLAALLATAGPVAHATLGQPLAAPTAGSSTGKAVRRQGESPAYSVQESTTPAGTTVRQYVDGTTGRVFAVVWQGPFLPDLQQLLGDYFQPFVQQGAARSRTDRLLRRDDVVVHSSGRMRAFSGRAYLPGQLPQGVSIDELH